MEDQEDTEFPNKCELCGGNYILKEKKLIGGAEYQIVKCEKCHHQVAKRNY